MLSGQTRGAVHRLGASKTAFSFRDANDCLGKVGVAPGPGNNERLIQNIKPSQ